MIHGDNGYLATFESSSDFNIGIQWVCESDSDMVGERASAAAVERFNTEVGDKYRTLYHDIYESD